MTVTVTLLELALVGVPEITPVPAAMTSGVGSPVADQVYGVVPPVAATVAEYALPAGLEGSDAVEIATPALTTRVMSLLVVESTGRCYRLP